MLRYFSGKQYEFFLPPYELTFFLVYGQTTNKNNIFSLTYHYNYFVKTISEWKRAILVFV